MGADVKEDRFFEAKEFFDADSFSREGHPRREVLADTIENIDDELMFLKNAVTDNDLERAREKLDEIKAWVDALDDDLCERDEDGLRLVEDDDLSVSSSSIK